MIFSLLMCVRVVDMMKVDLVTTSSMFAVREHGWLGADVASTIKLGENRVLWLFGDTLVGQFDPVSRTRIVERMPRNSVALMDTSSRGELHGLTFYVRENVSSAEDFHTGFFRESLLNKV